MKAYIKEYILATGIMAIGLIPSARAEMTLFNATLTIKEVSDPKVFVGRDMKQSHISEKNTFTIKVRPSDYFFTVKYQHGGESKKAVCPISGAPAFITATINPAKEDWEACRTEESSRG